MWHQGQSLERCHRPDVSSRGRGPLNTGLKDTGLKPDQRADIDQTGMPTRPL